MKASLLFKIFLGFVFAIAVLSTVIFTVSFSTIQNQYTDLLSDELKDLAVTLIPRFSPILETGNYQKLTALASNVGGVIDKRITIVDPMGWVLADSENDPVTMDNHGDRPEIVTALKGEVGRSLRYSDTMMEEMLYVAVPIEIEGEIQVGAVLNEPDNQFLNKVQSYLI